MAAVLGPVLAAGSALTPVVVTAGVAAGVTAAVVATAAPAKAATAPGPVLVVLVNGESSAPETALLQAAGDSVTQVTPAALSAMSQSAFDGYAAVVIGDSSSGGSCSATQPSTSSLGTNWEPWVSGNVAVLGTAPALPGTSASKALITDAAGYAAAAYSSSGSTGTGLYLSLNCGFSAAPAGTAVSLLTGVEGIGTAGGVTVNGSMSCGDSGTVNTWEADNARTFGGFTSGELASSSWPSPGCAVQEAFDSWPSMFTPAAYDSGSDANRNFTASDGVQGQPYVLLGSPAAATSAPLAPATGGDIPTGALAGGNGSPAAPGAAGDVATVGDPVVPESGDFTQSSTDVAVPGFGPSLEFTRTYDSLLAQQQTGNGQPGALGYGWTDNWATSIASASPQAGDIYVLAGLGTDTGMAGPEAQAAVGNASSTYEYHGNLYLADPQDNRVLEVAGATGTQWGISMTAGDIYTVAGSPTGASGVSANGTPAASSLLNSPEGVGVDDLGDLFIADSGNNRIVEIAAAAYTKYGVTMAADDLYTIAGSATGKAGHIGAPGPGFQALLRDPTGIYIGNNAGNALYIADTGNNRIQMLVPDGTAHWGYSTMTAGYIYNVAGSGPGTAGSSGDGGSADNGGLLDQPQGVTIDGSGDMIIADTGNCRIQEVPKASGAQWGNSASFTANDIYTIAGQTGSSGLGADGVSATSSDLSDPTGVAIGLGAYNGLYIDDQANHRVQEVDLTAGTYYGQSMTPGDVYTVAGSAAGTKGDYGDGGPATSALLYSPAGIFNDNNGNVWIADEQNDEVRELSSTAPYDITDAAGNGNSEATLGDNGPAATSALYAPGGEAFDAAGDIYFADTFNSRVQEIAASSHQQYGISMTAGDVYTVAGSPQGALGDDGNGKPADSAGLYSPHNVAVDAAGDLYISDTSNNRIEEVPASSGTQWGIAMTGGDMYTVAGSSAGSAGDSGDGGVPSSSLLSHPAWVTVDKAGDVLIADAYNNRVQEMYAPGGQNFGNTSWTPGDIYTVAGSTSGTSGTSGDGGPAGSALLNDAYGVATDSAGDLFIADYANNRVQEVAAVTSTQFAQPMTRGDMYTVAGSSSGAAGISGDGGPATSALLNSAWVVATDAAGDVYIADNGNNRIQEVPSASGTQWGQSMTAGDMYTVVGSATGVPGYDHAVGGPATSVLMNGGYGLAVDPHGDLYVTDANNYLMEVVSSVGATITTLPGTASPLYPAPQGLTVTQPGGAQVSFYPVNSQGTCTAPLIAAGSYCALPQDVKASLTYNSANGGSYTFSPGPQMTSYTYSAASGQVTSETDPAGNTLTVTYLVMPGTDGCPSAPGISSCEVVTPACASACARPLVIASNTTGQVAEVIDPMGRTWTYGYNTAGDLTSATDPMNRVTTYAYGAGSTGSAGQANDLLTVTGPNAQPGGPDAGHSMVNVYNAAGQVTQQTDPMGHVITLNYCANQADGDCLDSATGTGLVTVTDGDGNATVYDYNQGTLAAQSQWTGGTTSGSLTSETDYGADTTEDGTSAAGTLQDTWQADGNGNITTYTYDADGDTTSVTAPDGIGSQTATTTAWFDAAGNQTCSATAQAATPCSTSQTGPSPVSAGTSASPLTISPPSSAPPAGETWTLYDSSGNQLYSTTGVYQPGANSAAYSRTSYQLFDHDSVTLPGASTATSCAAAAPSLSLPCAVINADGVVTQLGYDSAGDPTSTSTPDGNAGGQLATTTDSYDGDGEPVSQTAPDGNISGATLATQANYTTGTAYNADGEVTSVTQGIPVNGTSPTVTPRVTSYGYDADGNKTSVADARGYTITTAYNADDQATLSADPDGNQTLTCYDGDGNVAQTVPPSGVAASGLTAASCPTSYPAGYGDRLAPDATTSTFNADGQRTAMTTPAPAGQTGSETTSYTYDGAGNVLQVSAPAASTGGPAQLTVSTYNSASQLASQTSGYGTPAASTTTYCYDPDGDTTAVVMPDGNTAGTATCETASPWAVSSATYPTQAAYQTTTSYDSIGEPVSTTSPATAAAPSGATTTATYDPAGQQLTSTSPDDVTTTLAYTPDGNTASASYSGSSAHPISYGYDADGSQTAMTDGTGTSSYLYDPFGDLTSATSGAGQTVGYSYDADGNTTGITYPLPAAATWATTDTVAYGYDKADTLTSVTDFNGHQIAITSNADSLPASETLGSTGDTITTSYDATDSPSVITLKNSASTLQSFTYSDAPDGSTLAETDVPASSSAAYTYDGRGRVASMTTGSNPALSYGFDASGNLTALPAGAAGTYDHDSELTSSALSGTTTSYAYNADGDRLSAKQGSTTTAAGTWNGADQLTAYSNNTAGMSTASYDGHGIRASATFTPAGGSPSTQNYTWNDAGSTPELLMDSASAYIYAGTGTPAEQVSLSAGTVTYLNSDSLGSVRGIITATGTLAATTSYDAWGNPQTAGGLIGTTPFGYAGAYTDPDGLLYLVNRYYDPATGQFTSVDPDVAQTMAPYGYADGNPVMNNDPDGLYAAYEAVVAGNVVTVSSAAQYHLDTYIAAHNPPPPPPLPRPVAKPKPRPKAAADAPGCSGTLLKLGACASERAAAGNTPAEVKQSAIGALFAIAGAVAGPAAEILGDALAPAEGVGSDLADEAADSCTVGGESFTGGTKVLLASGAAIPISQLKTGDKVLATSMKTGQTQPETVTAVLVHHDTDRYNLKIRAGHRAAVIRTTRKHLFWDQTQNKWVNARNLKHGDYLRSADGAIVMVVGGYTPRQRTGWMWDLTVPGGNDHDFYIKTSAGTILVHNQGGIDGCSDAAYQGVMHIKDEVASGNLSHDLGMSDDDLADYLDDYANSGTGQDLEGGGSGWYDAARGVMIIQRSEYSMTAYRAEYEEFLAKLR